MIHTSAFGFCLSCDRLRAAASTELATCNISFSKITFGSSGLTQSELTKYLSPINKHLYCCKLVTCLKKSFLIIHIIPITFHLVIYNVINVFSPPRSLHKRPYNSRFIANSSSCTTTELFMNGNNLFWSIKTQERFLTN